MFAVLTTILDMYNQIIDSGEQLLRMDKTIGSHYLHPTLPDALLLPALPPPHFNMPLPLPIHPPLIRLHHYDRVRCCSVRLQRRFSRRPSL